MRLPIESFFAQFATRIAGFRYCKDRSAHDNFKRLCEVSRWGKKSAELESARTGFKDALVKQFNAIYGTDSKLGTWQNLCSAIDITPVPDNIGECRKRVRDSHVNIVDLLETKRTGQPVRKHATLEELRIYTMRSRNIFPKKDAYTEGLLKELLREIENPYFGCRRNESEKRGRRKARKKAAAT